MQPSRPEECRHNTSPDARKIPWPVAFTGFSSLLVFGVLQSYGVLIPPLTSTFGWSRAAASATYSVYTVTYGPSTIITSLLVDKYKPGNLILLSGTIVGAGIALSSFTSELWHLYMLYGAMSGVGAGLLWVTVVAAVMRAFRESERLSLGVGLAAAGTGVGTFAFPPLTAFFVNSLGWRAALEASGFIVILATLPAFFCMREKPTAATGAVPTDGGAYSLDGNAASEGWSRHEALRTRVFWVLYALYALGTATSTLVITQTPSRAVDLGISLPAAGLTTSLIGIGSVLGRVVLAGLLRSQKSSRTFLIIFSFQAVTISLFLQAQTLEVLYIVSFVFGIFYGAWVPQFPIVTRNYFGLKTVGIIFGVMATAFSLGGSVGPVLGGFIHDVYGSYQTAYLVTISFMVTAVALAFIVKKPTKNNAK